jgi:hypothetical protein
MLYILCVFFRLEFNIALFRRRRPEEEEKEKEKEKEKEEEKNSTVRHSYHT